MQNFEASDIIYLYLDGEADDYQKNILFSSMANDALLQSEFHEAIQFQTRYSRDTIRKFPPPVKASQALFTRAGYNPQLITPPIVAAALSAQPGSFNAVTTKVLAVRDILIPIVSALAGALITAVAFIMLTHGVYNGPILHRTNKNILSQDISSDFKSINKSSNTAQPVPSNDFTAYPHSTKLPYTSTINGRKFKPVFLNILPEEEKQIPHIEYTEDLKKAIINITEVNPLSSTIIAPSLHKLHSQLLPSDSNIGVSISQTGLSTKYGAYHRQLTTIKLYPNRFIGDHQYKLADNTVLGGFFKFDENHHIIAEVGEEEFPVYVLNKTGDFEYSNTIQWLAGGYRYRMTPIELLGNIQPYGQVEAGYAFSGGGITKAIIGLQWQPFPNVSFEGGAEVTGLVYKLKGSTEITGKTGYYYGFSIHF